MADIITLFVGTDGNTRTNMNAKFTQANTEFAALKAGKAATSIYNATLTTTWTGSAAPFTQSVSVSGILATDKPIIGPVFSDELATRISQRDAWNAVGEAVTSNGSITFYCDEEKPTTEVPLQIQVVR